MKKLATLLSVLSLGLFVVGCDNAADGPEPVPGDAPAVEGGSGVIDGPGLVGEEEMSDEVPPVTDEPAPTLETPPAPEGEAAAPTTEEAAANESAVEAAEAADTAAPAEGENAPQ